MLNLNNLIINDKKDKIFAQKIIKIIFDSLSQ